MDREKKIKALERKVEKLGKEAFSDETTKKFKFSDKKFKTLSKSSKKKPDYVLVQYLQNNHYVDWKLCKVVSGNIIIVNNKGHELNPKDTWIRGKHVWYIVREKDSLPVSIRNKVKGHPTDDHKLLIKMVLGAVQKKETTKDVKKVGIIIGAIAVIAIIGYVVFGGA